MNRSWKRLVRNLVNKLGYDIRRISGNNPRLLMGLEFQPIKTVIDVGANQGQFAGYIRDIFPQAKIFCFEPIPDAVKKLKKWGEMQDNKVEVLPFALGDTNGKVTMFHHLDHSPSSSLLKTTRTVEGLYPQLKKQELIEVFLKTLDESMKPYALENDIFIKLDVQGFEDRVIRGGQKTLRRAKACLLEMNLDSLYEGQASFESLVTQLYQLGYHYAGNFNQEYNFHDGHVVFLDAMFVK